MEKVLWVKFGWSDYYRGGVVDGNFSWLEDHKGTEKEGRGHEAYNFMPAADGKYYCYVPPHHPRSSPWNNDNEGWTVICLAKNPKHKGIHVVGWYENATLLGDWYTPPPRVSPDSLGFVQSYDWSYNIKSERAYFIPPESRTIPFSDNSVRQAKYSFLRGPGITENDNKRRVLRILEDKLKNLQALAVLNPTAETVPDPELDQADPLLGFGTPEHRKMVELTAEEVVKDHYVTRGFSYDRVADLNCGYDYVFIKGKKRFNVEIKGTSGKARRFFLTRNEYRKLEDPLWRLALVTSVLDDPHIEIFHKEDFEAEFDLEPLVYFASEIPQL